MAPGAPSPTPQREQVALTGRSVTLDPRTHAVRPDLADVRLAGRVFAPHYAACTVRIVTAPAPLRAARDSGSETVATLQQGDRFELLDLLSDDAWGIGPGVGLVGYMDASLLAKPDE